MTDSSPWKRWRPTYPAMIRLVMALGIVLVWYAMGQSQTALVPPPPPSPFDVADSAADTEATVEQDEQAALPGGIPLTVEEALAARSPQTAEELLRAAILLQKVERYDAAKSYLEQFADLQLETQQLYEIYRDVGSGDLFRLAADQNLAPAGRDVGFRIMQAARQVQRDPARMRRAIADLTSTQPQARRAAENVIEQAGLDVVPVAIGKLVAGVNADELATVRRALVAVGPAAEGPLVAALSSPNHLVQAEAIRALTSLNIETATPYLLRPYFLGQADVQEAAATGLLQLAGSFPSSSSRAAEYLTERVTREFQRLSNPRLKEQLDRPTEIWTWSQEQKNVVVSEPPGRVAAAIEAARLSRDAYELQPDDQHLRRFLAARLTVDQRTVGLDQPLPKGAGTAREMAMTAGPATLSQLLDDCLQWGLDAAAIGVASTLGESGDASMLGSEHWNPLIKALHSSNRRVRYEAAKSIMQLDPRRPFAGDSLFFETLIELAQSSGQRRAYIGLARNDVASQLAGMLTQLGYDVERGPDGKDVLREAVRISDFDVLIVSDAVRCPPADEVLQQLRQDPQSAAIPVILLAGEGRETAAQRIADSDQRTRMIPEAADLQTLSRALRDLAQQVAHESVSPERRQEQAFDALGWLGHLAEYSQTYSFYDIFRSEPAAVFGLRYSMLAPPAIDLLGFLGSPSAQALLLETAGRRDLPTADRQRAANAFAEAVLRRGLMIESSSVRRQYDRYNASVEASAEEQAILGQILDVIETQTQNE